MTFKKLALAAAIATVPAAAFSVETLDDSQLAATTGQDGIEVAIVIGASGIQTDVYLHDKDGLAGTAGAYSTSSYDGAIVIDNMSVGVGGASIGIAIDVGDSSATAAAPVMNIAVTLPASLTIVTGDIYVANSGIDEGNRNVTGQTATPILNSMNITLGATTLNIQLGNEAQTGSNAGTDMIVLNSTITGGISITNMRLNDADSGGGIGASSMTITNSVGSDLTLNVDGNVTTSGLELDLAQIGDGGGMRIEIVDQYLGSTSAGIIGDVSVRGLNLNDTKVTISGK